MNDIKEHGKRPSVNKNFTVVRYDLSEEGSLNIIDGPNKVDFSFVGLWVSNSSNKEFDLNVKVNPKNDQGDAISLKPNMALNFKDDQDGCVFTYPAQSGKWVEITYSHHSAINSGSIEISQGGTVAVIEGNNFNMGLKEVLTTSALCFSGNMERINLFLENRGSNTIYLGDKGSCESLSYKDITLKLESGSSMEFKNRSGLYAITESVANSNLFYFEETQ